MNHTMSAERVDRSLARAAEAALVARGEAWTPLRAAVFDALTTFAAPASAYEITDAVSRGEGRRLTANSIYRILDLFTATNIITRVESRNAFIVNVHPLQRHDCILLVCDACGSTGHIDDDSTVARLRAVVAATDFVVARAVIEMRGRCAACAAGEGQRAAG
jgi:Fur family zinc uptake transcriptional regulator